MKDRQAEDWEELARREPYFAVLTNENYLGVASNAVATKEFFETGEQDIQALLPAIGTMLGREVPLASALDFGCGVGRLTLPLARRAGRVVAVDVAPTMLAHARQNAESSGLHNVTYIESHEMNGLLPDQFDFICSLLVLQHIPVKTGYEIIRTLLRVLAPGGITALHVTFERPGGQLRRLARTVRGRSRVVHRMAGAIEGDPLKLPYMQMNEYDERVLQRDIDAAGARLAGRFPRRHGDTTAAVLIIEK
ncbi:MAG TPA: class I SAM-dependent methyltransferase [Thermoanaerobaculia bacterium]|nr:class I SAM-dependent methyltransferase [Thermoanaerobaculia bacterium]